MPRGILTVVSWNWGSGNPKGEVAEVKEQGELVIESKGKEVKKNASPDNPVCTEI
jgi:hypothetical protein